MKKIFLRGYFTKNLGDDLFFYILGNRYRKIKFYAFSPIKYNKEILPTNIIMFSGIIYRCLNKIIRLITKEKNNVNSIIKSKCDFMIYPGGSIFYDDMPLDLLKRCVDIDYFNPYLKYIIVSSNISKVSTKNEEYNNQIARIIRNAEYVGVRDRFSYEMFKNFGNIKYNPDIVFSLQTDNIDITENKDSKRKIIISIINPLKKHKSQGFYNQYKKFICDMIKNLYSKKYIITLISFCEFEGDEEIIEEIEKETKKDNVKVSKYYYRGNIREALKVIASNDTVIGTRFHANVIGIILNKNVIPIVYGDKTYELLKDIKFEGKYFDIREKVPEYDELTEEDMNYYINIEKEIKDSKKHLENIDKILKKEKIYE